MMLDNKVINLVTCIFSLIVIMIYYYESSKYQSFVMNGKTFMIEKNKNIKDKNDSLQSLFSIRTRLDHLIEHLNKKYPNNEDVERLEKRYKDTIFKESNPNVNLPGKTSYTINKGYMIVLCLRTFDGKLVDINTLTYVALHELTHIYRKNTDEGHDESFWNDMRFIIKEGIESEIYDDIDYKINPVKYCGDIIKTNL